MGLNAISNNISNSFITLQRAISLNCLIESELLAFRTRVKSVQFIVLILVGFIKQSLI